MGLLSTLALPVAGPAKGLIFILKQIKERADAEQLDEGLIEDELVAFSLLHDLGEMADEEYMTMEKELLERLNAIRRYKESLAEAEANDEVKARV